MAQNQPTFVDLTLEDESDIDDPFDTQGTIPAVPRPLPPLSQHQPLPPPPPPPPHAQLGSFPAPNGTIPFTNRVQERASASENGFPEPPAKRQRTGSVASKPSAGPPDLKRDEFNSYLASSLCPRIDQTIDQLAPEYDEHWSSKLHYTILVAVTDHAFEHEWIRSGYKLSPAFEASLHARVKRLVLELKNKPGQLQSPPGNKAHQPTVRPSIETELDHPNRSVPGMSKAPTSTVELNLDDQDEDEDTHGASERSTTNEPAQLMPASPLRRPRPRKVSPVTPQRRRVRAKAKQWQSGRAVEEEGRHDAAVANTWFSLSSRPYRKWSERREFARLDFVRLQDSDLRLPSTIHVDFSDGEIRYLYCIARGLYELVDESRASSTRTVTLRHILKELRRDGVDFTADVHRDGYPDFPTPPAALLSRSAQDLINFQWDLRHRKLRAAPQILTISQDEADSGFTRGSRVPALLYAREITGNRGFGSLRRYVDFTTAFKSSHEDTLEPQIEWTNCAGDIMTLSWVSDTQFLCGTTTHSDSHNQQYNKPGNLLLGSTQGTLRAYPDHRILRPIVSHGDNALDSMIESQDPWLFSSVVDSDYDPNRKLAFTSSFDKTVKIWQVREDNAMEAVGTWGHEGRVNFVLASRHPSGLVATAADVITDAIRVYHIGDAQPYQPFDSYSCSKVHDDEHMPSEKWGYCPAAIRWGLAPEVQHLLLVGYSPRSLSGDDRDIPEDRSSTGELCLWDTLRKTQLKVNSIATQNVFEVAWHPSRNSFAAATSKAASLERADHNVKTQIRIFELNDDGQYGAIKTLDCPAIDINELTIRPNSLVYSYVAAGCTDGNVYVWDTAGSDLPMCVLQHGEPVEEFLGEKEVEDVGVKFIAWGTTADRLYTGSSDGVVKVWNIRHGKSVLVRDLIEVPGPITAGAFSPDHTKLVIGDGSGRVYLLSLEDDMEESKAPTNGTGLMKMQVGGKQKAIRRPRHFIPHPDVPASGEGSSGSGMSLGQERARGYLQRGEITLHPHPCIGALQGPNYADTWLYRAEGHKDEDVGQPLLAGFERHQQENIRFPHSRRVPTLRDVRDMGSRNNIMINAQNVWWEFHHCKRIDYDTRVQLEAEGVEIDSDYGFEYESSYEFSVSEEE
ncbi:hypothetical protein SCARD494_00914 [Seiridium cardinale]